ncbi:MAG TPA: radical SAM protein [bacterium]|nr:radical SAM protein [bacterium]
MTKSVKKDPPLEFVYRSDIFNNACKYDIPSFPMLVDFETTNNCNLTCLFCNTNIMKRKKGTMELSTFKKCVDEISEKSETKAIKFGLWGEPFLNKRFKEMLEYAKSKGLIIHAITNGFFLDRQDIWKNLDMLNISMQGLTKKEYQYLRNNKNYDQLVENIKFVMSHDERPYVNLSAWILDEMEEEVENFKKHWLEIVDSVGVGRTHVTRLHKEAPENIAKRQTAPFRSKPCNQVRTRLSVYWDGTVSPCCGDYETILNLGNVSEMSLKQIWDSEKINHLRKILATSDWSSIPFCSECNHRF